jgi:hypothetical protein
MGKLMVDLVIRNEQLAWKLLSIAQRENRSVESVLAALLARYDTEFEGRPALGTFAMLAQSAQEADIRSDMPTDTSERSREILENEYADYLKRHMNERPDSD